MRPKRKQKTGKRALHHDSMERARPGIANKQKEVIVPKETAHVTGKRAAPKAPSGGLARMREAGREGIPEAEEERGERRQWESGEMRARLHTMGEAMGSIKEKTKAREREALKKAREKQRGRKEKMEAESEAVDLLTTDMEHRMNVSPKKPRKRGKKARKIGVDRGENPFQTTGMPVLKKGPGEEAQVGRKGRREQPLAGREEGEHLRGPGTSHVPSPVRRSYADVLGIMNAGSGQIKFETPSRVQRVGAIRRMDHRKHKEETMHDRTSDALMHITKHASSKDPALARVQNYHLNRLDKLNIQRTERTPARAKAPRKGGEGYIREGVKVYRQPKRH